MGLVAASTFPVRLTAFAQQPQPSVDVTEEELRHLLEAKLVRIVPEFIDNTNSGAPLRSREEIFKFLGDKPWATKMTASPDDDR